MSVKDNHIAALREELREDFLGQADWRHQKAFEYPEDKRNLRAAERYERLAGTVDEVPGELLVAYKELYETEHEVEIYWELMKRLFYVDTPATATEFVRCFISRVTQGIEPLNKAGK